MPVRPLNICLIRSGTTDWDQDDRCQGTNNLPISQDGLADLAKMATQWEPHSTVRTLYCSPDEASLRTAQLFGQRCSNPKTRALAELSEVDMGLWQGLTIAELHERYTKAFARWSHDPTQSSAPNGESGTEALDRLRGVIKKRSRRSNDPQAIHLTLVLRPILHRIAAQYLGDLAQTQTNHEPSGTTVYCQHGAQAPSSRRATA